MFFLNFFFTIFLTFSKKLALIFFFIRFFFTLRYLIFFKNLFFFFNIADNNLCFFFDNYSIFFFFLLVFVRRIIIFYSWWYIIHEPKKNVFFFYIMLFIFFIFLLTNSRSMLITLVRWERVGIMSFFLIGWWFRRSEATICASQAMFYNRIRDFFFLVSILILFMGPLFLKNKYSLNEIFFFFLCFAIIAKSSQIFIHPWLPNAIERPTPVSSLLHSSTIVVARVFLLIRLNNISPTGFIFTPPLLGRLTMLFIGISGCFQKDIKKIIAYSTSSQLRFIIFTVFFISESFGFFLIFTHSFFKSLLFLVSRVLIHSDLDDQENFYLNSRLTSPICILAFILSSFSLMRIPFFSRFFSKHLILENIWSRVLNISIILVFIFRCIFTVIYSLNIIVVFLNYNKSKIISIEQIKNFFIWIPSILIRRVFFRKVFFFIFFFIEELYLNLILFFIPLFILIFRLRVFFWKKKIERGVIKYTFFYNPLLHSITSRLWLLRRKKFFYLDYFFFEYLLSIKKIIFYFFKIINSVKRIKILIILSLLFVLYIILNIY